MSLSKTDVMKFDLVGETATSSVYYAVISIYIL